MEVLEKVYKDKAKVYYLLNNKTYNKNNFIKVFNYKRYNKKNKIIKIKTNKSIQIQI
jgi:hypothetical protein